LGGYTLSSDFPVTPDALQSSYQGGGADGFVMILNTAAPEPQNALVYSSFVGGPLTDVVYAVGADDQGNLYATGTTNSTRFLSATPFEASRGSINADAFVLRWR
jgi:hypothetical protein